MNKNLINLAVALLFSVSAYAIQNSFDIWTNISDASKVYADNGYNNGELTISGFQKKVGSRVEKTVQLRIELFKKVGSRAEFTHYIGNISNGTNLPANVTIYKSNSNGAKLGSRSEGTFKIDTADNQTIAGELLNRPVSAHVEEQ